MNNSTAKPFSRAGRPSIVRDRWSVFFYLHMWLSKRSWCRSAAPY